MKRLFACLAAGLALSGNAQALMLTNPDEIDIALRVGVGVKDVNPANGIDPVSSGVDVNPEKDGSFQLRGAFEDNEGTGAVIGGGNVDPNQNLSVSATDIGAPTSFAVSLVTPFATPLLGLVEISGLAQVTASDAGGSGGTLLSDVLTSSHFVDFLVFGDAPGEQFVLSLLNLDLSYPEGGTANANASSTQLFDCGTFGAGGCVAMGIFIGFTGAGTGDVYTVVTELSVNPSANVPSPSVVALLGLGLGALWAGRRVAR